MPHGDAFRQDDVTRDLYNVLICINGLMLTLHSSQPTMWTKTTKEWVGNRLATAMIYVRIHSSTSAFKQLNAFLFSLQIPVIS